jgi:hypothetical protein
VVRYSAFFLQRGYPVNLLEEAATLARNKNREEMLNKQNLTQPENEKKDIFFISTFNPTDDRLVKIVRENWEFLGKSPTTSFMYDRKLVCGYRRPKNLRDRLVRANITHHIRDDEVRHEYMPDKAPNSGITPTTTPEPEGDVNITKSVKQSSITDFFKKSDGPPASVGAVQISTIASTSAPNPQNITRKGTGKEERGFNFCNRKLCRYCPRLNKSGSIYCLNTDSSYRSMKNISCRSSNLIYCVTCQICKKQYVGQTLLRIKDRFAKHFYDVQNNDQTKALGRHFSRRDHNGIKDMEISVVEFIKKPPRSPEASIIRDRVEKRWIHLLRCPAPMGLNIFD